MSMEAMRLLKLPSFYTINWNYGSYTWHTNRDAYDKVVFDDPIEA